MEQDICKSVIMHDNGWAIHSSQLGYFQSAPLIRLDNVPIDIQDLFLMLVSVHKLITIFLCWNNFSLSINITLLFAACHSLVCLCVWEKVPTTCSLTSSSFKSVKSVCRWGVFAARLKEGQVGQGWPKWHWGRVAPLANIFPVHYLIKF